MNLVYGVRFTVYGLRHTVKKNNVKFNKIMKERIFINLFRALFKPSTVDRIPYTDV